MQPASSGAARQVMMSEEPSFLARLLSAPPVAQPADSDALDELGKPQPFSVELKQSIHSFKGPILISYLSVFTWPCR